MCELSFMETPVDRGMRGSPHFSWRTKEHVPLWLIPEMRGLAREAATTRVSFRQCAFRCDYQKWTTLMAAGPRAARLRELGSLTCKHSRHGRQAKVYDVNTGSGTAESAEYPTLLCATLVFMLNRHEWHSGGGKLPLTDGRVTDDLLEALARQRSENVAAYRALIKEMERRCQVTSAFGKEASEGLQAPEGEAAADGGASPL